MDNFIDAYRQIGPPPDQFSCSEALGELLANTTIYSDSKSNVVPYVKELVSWPSSNNANVSLAQCLSAADREWLGGWRQQMLRPVGE